MAPALLSAGAKRWGKAGSGGAAFVPPPAHPFIGCIDEASCPAVRSKIGARSRSVAPSIRIMSSSALLLLSLLSAHGAADIRAYEKARHSFYVLKADASLRKDRGRWLGAATEFEGVAARYPRSSRAAEALYTAAELRAELSRLSLSGRDRRRARSEFHEVAEKYPRSPLADDALWQAARIELDRENDPRSARADLGKLLRSYPRGDMAHRAKRLLAELGSEEPAPASPHKGRARALGSASPRPTPQATASGEEDRSELAAGGRPEAQEDSDGDDDSPEPVAQTKEREAPDAGTLRELRQAGAAPGGVPLSVQMGLAVRRIIIDAGHGGHDTGAIGPGGTREKDVTLAIAQRLAKALRARGLDVVLTRDADEFVPLEERAKLANRKRGDLFVSIHANAAVDHRLRGTETYFLDVTADRYAIRLAARENQSTERSISDLQLILADLAQKAHVEESHRLALQVQESLCGQARRKYPGERDLGVKHALFYVLLGVKMPAILVETAFVSNPTEEQRLRSGDYQDEVAQDIAKGIERFVQARRELAGL
ncbi:MAG: N-acetylmuramoyl-L-alanine amidase [Deltaproteobacteria bacterium]